MIDGENAVRQKTGKRYLHLHHVPATRDHFCQWLSQRELSIQAAPVLMDWLIAHEKN
ncbi:MAG: hypothetical protein V7775_17505 [Sulfitobacter sp.]